MASVFGHAFASLALGSSFSKNGRTIKLLVLAILCAILPDADVIGFKFGIAYESFWGHRGFSHSIVFSILLGITVTFLFFRKNFFSKNGIILIFFFSVCTVSHTVLDAMTTGGHGVAFFAPFDNTRYFFPWRPIKVSPLGIANFFTERGLKVIKSELLWIGIPGTLYMVIMFLYRKIRSSK